MKIRQIPASRLGSIKEGETMKLSPTLQLLFGFVDADTTAVRNGIRQFFFGHDQMTGRMDTDRTEFEVSFEAGNSIGTRFADGIRIRNAECLSEWNKTLHEIDSSTYQAFFDLNFGEVESAGTQICFHLNRRFNAPYGDVSDGPSNQEQAGELKQEIARINHEITACRSESERLRSRLEELEGRQIRPYEFETKQKQTLVNRIANLEEKLDRLRSAACQLEEDIELALRSVVPTDSQSNFSRIEKLNVQLSDQLAKIDAQIERWKHVKLDVDGRLTELRSDLSSSRVGEFDGMFDDVRMINRISESKLLTLLENADENDADQLGFRELIELNHQLCDGLSAIQDQWREEIAKGEIDSLKRCSSELDGFLDRLAGKRTRLENNNPKSDLNSRCQCKTHLVDRVDLKRVEQMKIQLADLLDDIEVTENSLRSARAELRSLESHPDMQDEIEDTRSRIRVCNDDHSILQDEKDRLLNQLRVVLESEQRNSRLVRLISDYLRKLTGGEYRRLYLQENGHDLKLVNEGGLGIDYQDSEFVTRNRVRMAVSLGCARLLSESGYSVPLVWEDAFIGFEADEIDLMLTVLQDFTRTVGQIILLTNNRFVKQLFESKSVPCLDIPERYSGDAIPARPRIPERKSTPETSVVGQREVSRKRVLRKQAVTESQAEYSSMTDWSDINRDFDLAAMDQYGTEAYQYRGEVDRSTSYLSGTSHSGVSQSRSQLGSFTAGDRSRGSNRSRSSSRCRTRSTGNLRSGGDSRTGSSRSRSEFSQTQRIAKEHSSTRTESHEHERYKFYLEMNSRVEAAPTIGPKTAERLEKIGICTVSDLVNMDAGSIADQLGQRRIKSEDVLNWQRQALLVCEVPNMRGHDAQILVACGINDSVQLAGMDPDALFDVVGPFAKSKDGKKLLRGSTQPDLEEVRDWVRWARHEQGSTKAA